jgi:hypothetical protein
MVFQLHVRFQLKNTSNYLDCFVICASHEMVYPSFWKNDTSYNMSCSWENCMLDLFMIRAMGDSCHEFKI